MNNDYLQRITTNLTNRGFTLKQDVNFDDNIFDVVGHKTKLELTKSGLSDYFFIVKRVDEVTPENINSFSGLCFKYSKKHRKNFLPPGIFGGYWVFPVIVCDTVAEYVSNYVESTRPPKHWSSAEFPLVVDIQKNRLYYYQGPVTWGSFYQAGFKKLANEIVGN